MAVTDGEVTVEVLFVPRRWRFDAGPFSVFVEGASFTLGWTPVDERLTLQMYTGAVTVMGPLGTGAVHVRAGETLSVRGGRVSLSGSSAARAEPGEQGGPAVDGVDRQPNLTPVPAGEIGLPDRRVGSRQAGPRRAASDLGADWRALIAAGHSASVVADAQRRGLDDVLARGGREEMAALADASRYSRQNATARRALHALRDRFATSESAHDAAFFLGRLEETDDARSPRSIEWYRRYRIEAPRGLYVSESLGREMLIMRRLYGDDAATAIAREYYAIPHGHFAAQPSKSPLPDAARAA